MDLMDGYSLATEIRKKPLIKDKPIILYTNYSENDVELKDKSLVFNKVLCKASTETIIKAVKELLGDG